MIRKAMITGLIGSLGLLGGCATSFPVGSIYTDLSLPVNATELGGRPHKTGTAECVSYLSLVTTGDCSIETAKTNGGIEKVHHMDWHVNNILGIIGKYKLTVYGE